METEVLFPLVRKKLENIRIDPETISGTKLMLSAILAVHRLPDEKIDDALNDFMMLYQQDKINLNMGGE